MCHNARKRKSNTNDNLKREDDTRSEEKSSKILRKLRGWGDEMLDLKPGMLGEGNAGGQLIEFVAENA